MWRESRMSMNLNMSEKIVGRGEEVEGTFGWSN
jgi:hypothetical protein